MGSGIAAQIVNADLPVLLLDLPAKTAGQPHAAGTSRTPSPPAAIAAEQRASNYSIAAANSPRHLPQRDWPQPQQPHSTAASIICC